MKTCVIDCGGGLRDIYGAGVFDYCMDNGITFDMCIGISAGSANIASFISGQRGRNYNFYHEYAFRKEYMSFENVIKKKFYLDLDYVYGKLSNSNGEDPFDYDK
ncbi:MAG: patatin family protein, partial [Acutalibacteraceae bacterium]|nr:patatin family protein [Acutalibacteraceae bacterium]